MAEEKSLHRMPVADCGYSRWASVARSVPSNPLLWQTVGITKKSPSLKDTRGRLWVFEVGERSEVGALESSRNVNEVNHFREA